MKKTGIITFHRANNYGAIFQTYALKFVLQSLGSNTDVINYSCKQIENFYKFFYGKKNIKWVLKKFIEIIFIYKRIIINNNFNRFRKKYLTNAPIIDYTNIKYIENNYDIFITGSDQVFNPKITNFDSNYLLGFVKNSNKKYSYAASLGFANLNNKEELFLKNNLNSFSEISVREKQAQYILNKIINKKVLTHLDPTLLLSKEEWNEIAGKIDIKEDYVLLYMIIDSDKMFSFARKLAKEKNLKLINISSMFTGKIEIKNIFSKKEKIIHPKPEEWISYFMKAKYVVTNSFHGLTFSINLNKKFFIDFLFSSWAVNSRVENLLDLTNLRDRLIDNIGTDYDRTIDWDSVNEIVEKERKKALNYLRSIVLKNI